MGRDLFAEAGIVPDSAVEGRDLFAEAGLVPDAPPAKPLGTLDYLTRKLTQVGGKMIQGASIAGGGLAGAVGMDDLRDQAFDLSTQYGKFGKDTDIGVGTNDAAQSMTQRVAGGGVQAIPALAAFVANPALGLGLVSSLSMADSGDLISGGVDAKTAGKVFATDVAGNAVGMLPFVGPALGPVGNTITRRVLSGAAANAFQGGATDAAKQSILSGNGYEEQAQQYDPLNPEARIVDLLLGGGTGVHAHYSPEARQQRQVQQESGTRQARIGDFLAAQEAKVASDTQAAAHAADLQTYGPILEANGIDPNSQRAQGVIANLKAREEAKAQTQAEVQAETVPPSPEEIALAQRQQPPAVIPVDAGGRADAGEQTAGVKASMLDQGGGAALIDSMARLQREQRGADPLEQTATLQTEQPMPGEGQPMARQQTEQTTQQTNKQTEQTGAPRAMPAPKSEPTPANPVAESQAPAPKAGDGKVATAQASQLLADIRKRGGIDPKEALDLTGDNAFHAGQRMRGVFKKGGMSADGLLELMQQRQWLGPDATIAEARAMVKDAFNRREITSFDGLSDNVQAREAAGRWQEHQERMASDPEYRAEQERLSSDVVESFDVEPAPKVIDEADLATEYVTRFGEDALESLAIQHVDSADNFYNALRSELNGQAPKPEESRASGENQSEANQGSLRREAPESDFALEQHGDAELRQRERDRAEAGRAERALAAEVSRKERAAQNRAEQERRAAEVLKEREEKKKAEVDAAVDDFALGQAAPKPVEKRVSTEDARGQQNVFDQPAPQASEKLNLRKDGIDGYEIPWDSVANGNEKFQYAIGRTAEDGETAVFRRRADERGTYGGWRWEASKQKASANPERNLFEQPAQDAKPGNDPVDKLFGPDGPYSGNTNMHDISSAVGEALTRLSKGTFGEAKQWYDNIVENMRPLFAGGLNGKVEKPTGTKITIAQAISRAWPARIVQKLAGSIEGRMRMLAGDDLANMFYSEAGKGKAVGETFEQSSRHNALSALNRAMRAIDSVVPNAEKEFTRLRATGMGRAEARKASSNAADYAMRNLEARLRSNRFDSTALGKAAKEVAVVLKDWGDYLIRHGALAEGQLVKDGFLPRVMDTQKILYSKGNSEQAFRKDLDAALRREGIANPKEVVDEWIANLASNQFGVRHEGEKTDFILSDATAMPNSLKSRKLSKAFEKTMQEKGWYVSDLPTVLSRYFAATARKAEFMRLMGKDMEQWAGIKKKMTDEGNAKHIREVIQLIKSATGMGGDGHPTSVDGVTLAAGTRAFTALSAMERVTLSSVNDPVQAAVTSGRPQDMAKLAKDVVQILANSSDKAEAMRFAENLGLASKAHDDHIALSRLGMDTDGSAQTTKAEWMDSLTGRFMRSIGMPQLQYASRVAATDYGRIIVRDWLASAVSGKGLSQKNAIFNLKDMGIPESRIKEVHALVEQAVNGKVTWEQISKGGAAGELMTTAIRRFATRSVIEVTKSEKPKWAVSSPTGKMVYALQSFAAGYAKNVLDRFQNVAFNSELNAAQKATLLAGPAVGMAGIALLQSLMWELRDLIFGTTAVEPKTVGQKAMRAVSAAGVFGRADTLMQAFTGTRYGRDLSSMGVGYVGQVGTRALETTYRFIDPEAKALNAMGEKSGRPLNSPNNNTADRAFVGMLHDIFVEPVAHGMIALAAPTAGVSVPVAMGAQMMIGSPMVKESMVSAVAGEKKQHKQQQRQW